MIISKIVHLLPAGKSRQHDYYIPIISRSPEHYGLNLIRVSRVRAPEGALRTLFLRTLRLPRGQCFLLQLAFAQSRIVKNQQTLINERIYFYIKTQIFFAEKI